MGITNKQRGGQLLPGLGPWVDVPFNAANFLGAGGMTWAVTAAPYINRYCRIGNLVVWNLWVAANSTLGGTAGNQVTLLAPTPGKVARYAEVHAQLGVQAPAELGLGKLAPSSAGVGGQVGLNRVPLANFTLGSLQVQFTIMYEYGDT